MKTLLLISALVFWFLQFSNAQTTNVANPVVSITKLEGGVFVDYSAEIGHLYWLESSTTLTNWVLVEERVADATNMQFFIANSKITLIAPTNSVSGGGGPAPSPNGSTYLATTLSMSADMAALPRRDRALPYPWELVYQPRPQPQLDPSASTANQSDRTSSAEAESGSGSGFEPDSMFFRVRCPDTRIAFPNWVPFTDQFLYFTVWTSITNAGSTYRIVLSRDGVPIFTNAAAVPANGTFGVADGTYNPADWPFTGYYSASTWTLAGAITPPPPVTNDDQTIQFNVDKTQRKSFPVSRGLVVNQHGSLIFSSNDWVVLDEEFTDEMLTVYDYNLAGSYQVDLNFAFRDPPQYVLENLNNLADWTRFKSCIFSNPLSHLHYFGHGAPDRIGSSSAGQNLTLAELKKSPLTNNPLHYVGLDGCQVVKNSTDMLAAFVGYKTKITRLQAAANGFTPGYGWGWKDLKQISYLQQGAFYDKHFFFIRDFYDKLTTERSATTGLLIRTYKDASDYALDPNGLGWGGGSVTHNSEGEGFDYTGCYTCFFDDF